MYARYPAMTKEEIELKRRSDAECTAAVLRWVAESLESGEINLIEMTQEVLSHGPLPFEMAIAVTEEPYGERMIISWAKSMRE